MHSQAILEPARSLFSFIPDLAAGKPPASVQKKARALQEPAREPKDGHNPGQDNRTITQRKSAMKSLRKETGIRVQTAPASPDPLNPSLPLLAQAYCHTGYIRLATRKERGQTR